MIVVGIATSLVLLLTRALRRGLTIAIALIGVLLVVLETPFSMVNYESMSEAILVYITVTLLPTMGIESPVVFPDYIAADNNYLSMALQMGIPGLLFFVLSQITALRRIVPQWKKGRDDILRMTLGTAVGWIVGMAGGALFLNVWGVRSHPASCVCALRSKSEASQFIVKV